MAHKIDKRHGGPFDRGGADSWYQRGYQPHYYTGGSMSSTRVPESEMTVFELAEYAAGYQENEEDLGARKVW